MYVNKIIEEFLNKWLSCHAGTDTNYFYNQNNRKYLLQEKKVHEKRDTLIQ